MRFIKGGKSKIPNPHEKFCLTDVRAFKSENLCFQAHCGGSRIYFYFVKIYLFILVLAALGLHCCARAFLWLRRSGAALRCGVRASHGGGPCFGAQA